MKHIVLISCVKRKAKGTARCEDLYTSDLFRKSLAYARKLGPDAIYILSAKYGLVDLAQELESYDETLKTMSVGQIRAWSERVLEQLRRVARLEQDHFTFLAAEKYRRFLLPHLPHHEIPMEGLGIGCQLRYLKERLA